MRPPHHYRPPAFEPPEFYRQHDDELAGEDKEDEEMQSTSAPQIPHFSPRPQPFDVYMCDKDFWSTAPKENDFSKLLILRNTQITPNEKEQTAVTNMMTRVKLALENIAAGSFIPSVVKSILILFAQKCCFRKLTNSVKSVLTRKELC